MFSAPDKSRRNIIVQGAERVVWGWTKATVGGDVILPPTKTAGSELSCSHERLCTSLIKNASGNTVRCSVAYRTVPLADSYRNIKSSTKPEDREEAGGVARSERSERPRTHLPHLTHLTRQQPRLKEKKWDVRTDTYTSPTGYSVSTNE